MLLHKLRQTPEKMVPVAMALVAVGLLLMVLSAVWTRLGIPLAHMGRDWSDFVRGMLIGVALGLEAGGVVIAAAAATARAGKR